MGNNLVVDVVQMGAREHYAVPLMLQREGLLRYLHTDLYSGPGSALHPLFRLGLDSKRLISVRKMKERASELPARAVKANNLLGLMAAVRLHHTRNVYEETVVRHQVQRQLAVAALSKAKAAPDVFVGFRGSELLFELGRDRSCCILDQIDGGIYEVDLIVDEQKRHPTWCRAGVNLGSPQAAGSWRELEGARLQKEWHLADAIVCNSEWTRFCLSKSGVSIDKCHVIPLAYTQPSNIPAASPRRNRPDGLRVAFLGSVTIRKGIHILLEAARIASESIDIQVEIAGPLDIPIERVREYADISRYRGAIARSAVTEFLLEADVLVLPSISEGFGIVQLEAMSLGIPVIASDHTGDVVRDGVDGFVVKSGDVVALSRALVHMGSDLALAREMSEAARDRSTQFGPEFASSRWRHVIDETWQACRSRIHGD